MAPYRDNIMMQDCNQVVLNTLFFVALNVATSRTCETPESCSIHCSLLLWMLQLHGLVKLQNPAQYTVLCCFVCCNFTDLWNSRILLNTLFFVALNVATSRTCETPESCSIHCSMLLWMLQLHGLVKLQNPAQYTVLCCFLCYNFTDLWNSRIPWVCSPRGWGELYWMNSNVAVPQRRRTSRQHPRALPRNIVWNCTPTSRGNHSSRIALSQLPHFTKL